MYGKYNLDAMHMLGVRIRHIRMPMRTQANTHVHKGAPLTSTDSMAASAGLASPVASSEDASDSVGADSSTGGVVPEG